MGLFCHENLCAVLDVSLEHCPVHSIPGGRGLERAHVMQTYVCAHRGHGYVQFAVCGV